ncbi:MAG: chemotaxis protein CheW [Epsilonproteobacteria bacterium]|nr:chemotaxis protein CheW [Campylobacterota bacterium]
MSDLIVFKVANNRYALDIENIQRIIQSKELTEIPNAHPYIDGMMSYEKRILKVLNFRRLTGLKSYDEELKGTFAVLKEQHKSWVESLLESVEHGTTFTKTTDPHKCDLGKWLDGFNSYNDHVSAILKDLNEHHKHLHVSGGDALKSYESGEKAEALRIVKSEVYDTYNRTMGDVTTLMNEFNVVADSLQKLIIYEKEGNAFAIKVDSIEDIAHVDDSKIMLAGHDEKSKEYLDIKGVLDINGQLINVIESVKLPK